MEFQFIRFPISSLNLFLLLFFLFLLVKLHKKIKTSINKPPKLPPGPAKLPLIGNMHNLIGGRLPHQVLRDLAKKYGPLMHLQIGEVCAVFVSSAKMAKEFLITHDPAFASRPDNLATKIIWYDREDLAFSPYGDHAKQLRKICVMEFFSGRKVRSFSLIRQDEISKLIDSIRSAEGRPINVNEKFFAYTGSVVCRAAFGNVCKNKETMLEHLRAAVALAGGFNLADLFPSLKILPIITGLKHKLLKVHRDMDEILGDIIEQHKANHESGKMGNAESGDEDIVDVLLRQQRSGNLQIPITTRNIKGVLLNIFTAGTGTSAVTIEWAMSELMKQPILMAKAQDEVRKVCKGKDIIGKADIGKLKYLNMVIQETLRLHPPTPLIPRLSSENRVVKGYIIPPKAQVVVNAWAIGRDPEHWDDSESFKPERFEHKSVDFLGTQHGYFPFGLGRRMCPGITFGLANVALSLASLLYHFDWKLPNGMAPDDLDMDEFNRLSVGRKNNLHLVALPYDPSRID